MEGYKQRKMERIVSSEIKHIDKIEEYTLTNEELQIQIKLLSAQIGNLEVQIADYKQIIEELSQKIQKLEAQRN